MKKSIFVLLLIVYAVQCRTDTTEEYMYINIVVQCVTCFLQFIEIMVIIGLALLKSRRKG